MANQASVNLDGSPVNQPEGVVGNITEFGNDVMTLIELQAQLAALDFKEAMARATIPLILIVVGAALLLASLPVALLGIAWLLATALSMSIGWAALLTAAVTAVVAAVVAAGGPQALPRAAWKASDTPARNWPAISRGSGPFSSTADARSLGAVFERGRLPLRTPRARERAGPSS